MPILTDIKFGKLKAGRWSTD